MAEGELAALLRAWAPRLFSDAVLLMVVQALIVATVVWAKYKDWESKQPSEVVAVIKRGKETVARLDVAYAIASGLLAAAISLSNAYDGYKVLLTVINFPLLWYLFLRNGWFRGLVVQRLQRSLDLKEYVRGR